VSPKGETPLPLPVRFLAAWIGVWLGRYQQQLIEYQREEIQMLREKLGGRRLRFGDGDRRRLAVLGKKLGRRALGQVTTVATPVRLPARSPNLNAFAERFVLSIRSECLDRIIPLGEWHLRRAVSEYLKHYHQERNHQGLGNVLIDSSTAANAKGRVRRRQRLGGLLSYYHREAA